MDPFDFEPLVLLGFANSSWQLPKQPTSVESFVIKFFWSTQGIFDVCKHVFYSFYLVIGCRLVRVVRGNAGS